MSSPLAQRLAQAKWGNFPVKDLFEIESTKRKFDANKVVVLEQGTAPYVIRSSINNGQKGYLNENEQYLNPGNTISFGQDTATMFYQELPYFTGDKIKILIPRLSGFNKKNAHFFITALNKVFSCFSWGSSSFNVGTIGGQVVPLPVSEDGKVDFELINSLIAELEAEQVAELEAYLKVSGLDEYVLTNEEQETINKLTTVSYKTFDLKSLFGKSTRGKRLKSSDRIPGPLPFVTAGEADEGISDFIGNPVHIFSKNTTTIDMFGSAKYRCYDYGGDDHIAVVHTENLSENAAIFVTSAIHKSSHNGQFSYGRNFYAKDADELSIKLPEKSGQPDYETMEHVISAVKKLVIREVVEFTDKRIAGTKQIIG